MSSLALSFNYSFAGSLRSCGDLLKNTKINTLYIKNIRFLKKSVADASFRGGFLNLSSDNYFYLEYTHFKKSFMFYVTLVLLFILVGILDIFSYSNSALSLMVYLLFIVLILLLVLYTPASVADKLNELEHHLITFSSLKNKSAAAASSLLNVSAGLKANLNLTFFIV